MKPSFEYLRTEIDLKGKVRRAVISDPGQAPNPNTNPPTLEEPTEFRFLNIDAKDDLTVDGIGAGLEIEADAGRAGPFILSLYLSGQAYRVLGDRDVTFEGPPADLGSEGATFDFEVDPWEYRGGVGLRFRFVPENDEWWPFR